MRILVVAEHDHGRLLPLSRHVVSAALQIGGEIDVLVAGARCQSVAEQAALLPGVSRVKWSDVGDEALLTAENVAALIVANASPYSHILSSASTFGKNVLPRVAALLDVEPVSDVCQIISADTFVRPMYAGNVLVTVRSADPQKILSIRATAFEALGEGGSAALEQIASVPDTGLSAVLRRELAPGGSSRRVELSGARVVIAGGRALGSAQNFTDVLTPLASKLGAAVGASYGAVSAGYADNAMQIGQTGKIIAPDLYIAIGISGAIQHLAGIKESKVIVAINKDPEAPIFKIADYGLVADLFDAVPAMVRALK